MTISPNKWELDVQGYLNTCNITSATPRKQIRDFSAGVNDLGLWNSMVCWPLRSSQNYGSGDTVFSLGGLGTFNGTRVNGPAWANDGIDFDGSDDRITLPNESFGTGNAATSIWAFLKNQTNPVRMVALSQGDNSSETDSFSVESPTLGITHDAVGVAFTIQNIATKSTDWKSLFVGNTSAGFFGKNGGTVTQFSTTGTVNKTGNACAIGAFGDPAGLLPFDGLVAAVIRINATPTTTINGQVYAIYKDTLGQGLGLP